MFALIAAPMLMNQLLLKKEVKIIVLGNVLVVNFFHDYKIVLIDNYLSIREIFFASSSPSLFEFIQLYYLN